MPHIPLLITFLFIATVTADGFTCMQWRHTKDRVKFAQTCSVYGAPRSMPYWELVGTWKVWSTCLDCAYPFHNFSKTAVKAEPLNKLPEVPVRESVVRNRQGVDGDGVEPVVDAKEADVEEVDVEDPNTLCPCCIYGEAPYYDNQFMTDEINPATGRGCESKKYQFSIMGQWKTSHFGYSAYSWCFWQLYRVTDAVTGAIVA